MDKVKFFIEGHTHLDRHLAIRSCETILNTYGYLEDFKMFSDLAITLVVEIPPSKLKPLLHALQTSNFLTIDNIEGANKIHNATKSGQDILLYFYLSFVHHEHDFHKEVWAF
jgi:hypothetical protein